MITLSRILILRVLPLTISRLNRSTIASGLAHSFAGLSLYRLIQGIWCLTRYGLVGLKELALFSLVPAGVHFSRRVWFKVLIASLTAKLVKLLIRGFVLSPIIALLLEILITQWGWSILYPLINLAQTFFIHPWVESVTKLLVDTDASINRLLQNLTWLGWCKGLAVTVFGFTGMPWLISVFRDDIINWVSQTFLFGIFAPIKFSYLNFIEDVASPLWHGALQFSSTYLYPIAQLLWVSGKGLFQWTYGKVWTIFHWGSLR